MDVVSSVKNTFFIIIILILSNGQVADSFMETGVLSWLVQGARDLNGTTCLGLLHEIDEGLKENAIWAYKMHDASGFQSSGFIWGNNFFLGSKEACDFVNNYNHENEIVLSSRYRHRHTPELLVDKPQFPVNYRVIYAETYSQYQIDMQTYTKNILHFGVCVPVVCNDIELAGIMQTALNGNDMEIENRTLAEPESHFLNATVLYSKTLALRHKFFENLPFVLFTCVVLLHILVAVVCTILDKNVPYMPRCLEAFSWRSRWNDLVNCNSGDHEHNLMVVHGIKALSMLWIIMGHTTFFSMASIDNLSMILPYMTQIMKQPVFTSPTSVDTFFAISAFLMSYLLFKHKRDNPKFELDIFKATKMIIYRFLRFTPAYVVAILLILVVSMALHDVSPYWMIEDNEKNCKEHWWRNLLYVNNFYPIKEMCMSWSWYLSVELQCFTVGVLLMVIYYKNKSLGLILAFLTFKCSLFVSSMKAIKANYALSLDVQYHTLDLLYTPFWTRIGAYIIGMLSGHFLSIQRSDILVPKWFFNLTTVISQLCFMFVIHAQAIRQENQFIGPFIAGFGRIIWAWAICWTVIACSTGHLKHMNNFLSKYTFIVLSRLTYSVYLINPICIITISMMLETPIHLAPTNTFLTGLGFVVVIYMAAMVFKFLFEDPYTILLKCMFNDIKKSSSHAETTSEEKNNNANETRMDNLESQTATPTNKAIDTKDSEGSS